MKTESEDFQIYLHGEKLVGDDYCEEELKAWYRDEAAAYSGLVCGRAEQYTYEYHALNFVNGYRYLETVDLQVCLGYGAATGAEFLPIANRIHSLIIIDPGEFQSETSLFNVPVRHVKPQTSGIIPLENNYCDIVTCFGALHHVANVSFVIKEMARILKPSGKLLIREPISNMGDWRIARAGLTPRERGIPVKLMNEAICDAGLEVNHMAFCDFSPLRALVKRLGMSHPYNFNTFAHLDRILSGMFGWNVRYHRPSFFDKFAPGSGFWICSKGVL